MRKVAQRAGFRNEFAQNRKTLEAFDSNKFLLESGQKFENWVPPNIPCLPDQYKSLFQQFITTNTVLASVGILSPEMVSQFQGQIKQSPEDFVVREIDENMDIVDLTCKDLPLEDKQFAEEFAPIDANEKICELQEQIPNNLKLIQIEFITINNVIKNSSNNNNTKRSRTDKNDNAILPSALLVNTPLLSIKENRRTFHEWIRKYFSKKYISDTVTGEFWSKIQSTNPDIFINLDNSNTLDPKQTYIRLIRKDTNNVTSIDKRSRQESLWPSSINKSYLRCVLKKKSMETGYAVQTLARILGTTVKAISYSGTKDKYAITMQNITLRRITASKLLGAIDLWRNNEQNFDMEVGNFTYVEEPLRLGQHNGNHFTICIRNIIQSTDKESIEEKLIIIKKILKNISEKGFINYFGLQRFGTHQVPSHVIGWQMIRRDFKKVVESILYNISNYKNILNNLISGDAIGAWKILSDGPERTILKYLIEQGSHDFENAFRRIPRQQRMLYLHAYQSYIFNITASLRFSYDFQKLQRPDIKEEDIYKVLQGDIILLNQKPHIVTKDEEDKNIYTVQQVIFPLVGTEYVLPSDNIVSKITETLLNIHGIDNKSLRRAFEVEHLLQPNEEWSVKYRQVIIRTDIAYSEGDDTTHKSNDLHVSFSLPSSSYATVALAPLISYNN